MFVCVYVCVFICADSRCRSGRCSWPGSRGCWSRGRRPPWSTRSLVVRSTTWPIQSAALDFAISFCLGWFRWRSPLLLCSPNYHPILLSLDDPWLGSNFEESRPKGTRSGIIKRKRKTQKRSINKLFWNR